ncbi:2-C-methyl-D-erythritol 4-phosphate cytidylyltransferase [Proteiniborus sp. MB09-C3]|uniref:2-C-methyl-D-erythritol 4-phosphate cytidylyltransferase n=1 Tax=Proteiniborus sp. MB09-C3 TaxID=3050072 RepID=UPI002554B661|nr:2-C-methyl-D-erythritol 4-phosphate cytidylyltransferase [Proteiniborus sp. MB09-C3]WIV13116.1 2-C-methyl-D-erythritol 4-phosphate cytidylyltransferase [Proteiniborus sp. MB09-C3]
MSYNGKYISVVIVAAGMGKRMNSNINKQYLLLKEKPILAYTIEKFDNNEYIDELIIVTREEEKEYCLNEVVKKYGFKKVANIVGGGAERQDSVYKGLLAVKDLCNIIIIHDGVRPFIRDEDIINSVDGVIKYGACVMGTPVKDTIKTVSVEGDIINTPDRNTLWAIQTPQSFSYEIILKAYREAIEGKVTATDDSMLVEKLGYKVKVIEGSYSNIKITTPEDLKLAELLL